MMPSIMQLLYYRYLFFLCLHFLARDVQAKLALIVAQCLSIHLFVHLCVCP